MDIILEGKVAEPAPEKGRPVARLTSVRFDTPLADLPPTIREALGEFDFNGDGVISGHELHEAANLYKESRGKVRKLLGVVALLCLLLVAQLGATFGLVYAVVAIQKDTSVSGSDPVLRTKRGGEPVGTASVTETVFTSELEFSSPDTVDQLQYVSFSYNGMDVSMKVLGTARLPLSAAGPLAYTYGLRKGPLVLVTQAGNLLLTGTQLQPLDGQVASFLGQVNISATAALAPAPPVVSGRRLEQTSGSSMSGTRVGGTRPMAVSPSAGRASGR